MKKLWAKNADVGEQPADLLFWVGNGACGYYLARARASTEVSIGRTNSKRALGFEVSRGDTRLDFVLNAAERDEAERPPPGRSPPLWARALAETAD